MQALRLSFCVSFSFAFTHFLSVNTKIIFPLGGILFLETFSSGESIGEM